MKRLIEAALYCTPIQNQRRFKRQLDKNKQLVYGAGWDIRTFNRTHWYAKRVEVFRVSGANRPQGMAESKKELGSKRKKKWKKENERQQEGPGEELPCLAWYHYPFSSHPNLIRSFSHAPVITANSTAKEGPNKCIMVQFIPIH